MDGASQVLGLEGEGLLISGDPEEAELLSGLDHFVVVNEASSADGFAPDVDRLGRIEAVDGHVRLDALEDLGLDREERERRLLHGAAP